MGHTTQSRNFEKPTNIHKDAKLLINLASDVLCMGGSMKCHLQRNWRRRSTLKTSITRLVKNVLPDLLHNMVLLPFPCILPSPWHFLYNSIYTKSYRYIFVFCSFCMKKEQWCGLIVITIMSFNMFIFDLCSFRSI